MNKPKRENNELAHAKDDCMQNIIHRPNTASNNN